MVAEYRRREEEGGGGTRMKERGRRNKGEREGSRDCLLYTSDAADEHRDV